MSNIANERDIWLVTEDEGKRNIKHGKGKDGEDNRWLEICTVLNLGCHMGSGHDSDGRGRRLKRRNREKRKIKEGKGNDWEENRWLEVCSVLNSGCHKGSGHDSDGGQRKLQRSR